MGWDGTATSRRFGDLASWQMPKVSGVETRTKVMRARVPISPLLALLVGCSLPLSAMAETYPSRAVTLVVPFGAGGPLDTMARILAERMRTPLGQNVVVENVSGASGSIGVGRVVRAAPDGYTVSIGNWPTHVVN